MKTFSIPNSSRTSHNGLRRCEGNISEGKFQNVTTVFLVSSILVGWSVDCENYVKIINSGTKIKAEKGMAS